MITVTLQGYKPSPRFDGLPWTAFKVQESVTKDGPWTDLLVGFLNPIDTDPTEPQERSFTVETEAQDAWYRVVFVDATDSCEYTIPRWNHQAANYNYLPTVDQVARRLMSRTVDNNGRLIGNFTSSTTPTDEQVESIIFDAVKSIADQIGDTVPDELLDDASDVVALAAALRIEIDFFPDQVNTGRSVYPQLEIELNGKYTGRNYQPGALAKLMRQITMMNEGEAAVTDAEPSRRASFGFSETDTLTGRTTQSSDWMTRRW